MMNTPQLRYIDHVHVYVSNRNLAERWYERVLGLRKVDALLAWAEQSGPLTLGNDEGSVHLALFEQPDKIGVSAIAFGCDAEEFLAWRQHLSKSGIQLRITDHQLSISLYFSDPDGNTHEITTYQCPPVREALKE